MFVLFGLIFEVFKILILSIIYATLLLLLGRLYSYFKTTSLLGRITKRKLKFWLLANPIIFIGLFSFMFTPYDDHGLGDWASIPLGHSRRVQEVDGTRALIQDTKYDNGNGIDIENFAFTNDFLCGKALTTLSDYPGDYFVYDLTTNQVKFYKEKSAYEMYAVQNKLPLTDNFKDFTYYYDNYWGGWRFWLLP